MSDTISDYSSGSPIPEPEVFNALDPLLDLEHLRPLYDPYSETYQWGRIIEDLRRKKDYEADPDWYQVVFPIPCEEREGGKISIPSISKCQKLLNDPVMGRCVGRAAMVLLELHPEDAGEILAVGPDGKRMQWVKTWIRLVREALGTFNSIEHEIDLLFSKLHRRPWGHDVVVPSVESMKSDKGKSYLMEGRDEAIGRVLFARSEDLIDDRERERERLRKEDKTLEDRMAQIEKNEGRYRKRMA